MSLKNMYREKTKAEEREQSKTICPQSLTFVKPGYTDYTFFLFPLFSKWFEKSSIVFNFFLVKGDGLNFWNMLTWSSIIKPRNNENERIKYTISIN